MKRVVVSSIFVFCVLLSLLELGSRLVLKHWLHIADEVNAVAYQKKIDVIHDPFNGISAATVRAHPFFGYVNGKEVPGVNSMGFQSPYEFPYRKKPGEFVIGVFGGSVARNFAFYLSLPEVARQFEADLKKSIPRLRDRKVVLLNFALGCGKQPQQFAVYAYFAETMDFSINLDGYNDVEFNTQYLPVEYPGWTRPLFSGQPKYAKAKEDSLRLRDIELAISRFPLKHPVVASSGLYRLLWEAASHRIEIRKNEDEDILNNDDSRTHEYLDLTSQQIAAQATAPGLEMAAAKNWEKYTLFQAALAKQLHKPALFLLQPNLNVRDSKKLSQKELALFPSESVRMERETQVTRAYGYLREAQDRLRKAGVPAFDLTGMFRSHPESLYWDSCCHIDGPGEALVETEVVRLITHSVSGFPNL